MVALDVVAHEVSHGFTQQNSNLVYRNQSGGINESFSDIAAAIYYAEGDYNWLIGDRIKKKSGARRYMNNPPQDGVSIDHVNQYRDGMDVHHSSGIYNRAFHLLATSTEWNIKKAFEVMVQANRIYWIAKSNFSSAGQGVYLAAKDLGYCVDDVVDALNEVGVTNSGNKNGEFCSDLTPPPIRAEFDYSVENLTATFTDKSTDLNEITAYSWNFGDGVTSTQQHPTYTYTQSGTYQVSLTVASDYGDTDTQIQEVTVFSIPDQCNVPEWDSVSGYEVGDRVTHKGGLYESSWWNHGANPEIFSNVWDKIATCSDLPNDKIQSKFSYVDTGWLVNFTSESTSELEIVDYEWDFGDGSNTSFFNETALRLYKKMEPILLL